MPLILALIFCLVAIPVLGDQLTDALQEALDTNPDLDAEKARLKASGYRVDEARAGWLPAIEANGSLGRSRLKSTSVFGESIGGGSEATINLTPTEQAVMPTLQPQLNQAFGQSTPQTSQQNDRVTSRSYNLSIKQPIFKGGQLVAGLRKSKSENSAAFAEFEAKQQKLLIDVIEVYGNLYVSQEELDIRRHNEKRLKTQLEAEELRKKVGRITQADVLQAKARYQAAYADRLSAESAHRNYKQDFERFVGRQPGLIKKLYRKGALPSSLISAVEKAARQRPQLKNLRYSRDALKYEEKKIWGEQGPELSLKGELSQSFNVTSAGSRNTSLGIFAELRIPLFEPGVTSRARAARADTRTQDFRIDDELRAIRQNVTKAWEDYRVSKAQVLAREAEKSAFERALRQIEEEQRYGMRTTLNVLDAKQEDLDVRVKLVTAEKNVFIGHYKILYEIGGLTPEIMGLQAGV